MAKITYPEKNIGDQFKSTEANEIKASVNALYDEVTELDASLTNLDDDVIHKNTTPEVKEGGLTIGINNTKVNDNWIAFGTSVTDGEAYTTPAARQLNLTVLNYGVSGSTSNDLVNHYAEIPTLTSGNQDQYRLLSIEHSINDSSQSVPLATFRANLENCIANAKGKNWPNNKILIINGNYCTNAPMITTQEAYADEAIAIAIEQGVQYYDAYNYTKNNGGGSLLSDGVHPSTAGGLVYARGLIASMQGGMEITGGLTVINGITTEGHVKVGKEIDVAESINTRYNKPIQYVGAWTNKIFPTDAGGGVVISCGFATGRIDFNVSASTNVYDLAMRIASDKTTKFLGGTRHPIRSVSATSTLLLTDYTLLVNATSSAAINLPTAAAASGVVYVIKRINNTAFNSTVIPNGSETIDGAANYPLTVFNQFVMIQSDGSNWQVISKG